MENATKALLISAGVLIAVMLLAIVLLAYNQLSDYYQGQSDLTEVEQTTKFNSRFENYYEKEIRGNELISVMNRIIDYNERESYLAGTKYPRIEVNIFLDGKTGDFKYDSSDESIFDSDTITNITSSSGGSRQLDNQLIAVTNITKELISDANSSGISNVTEGKLQQLSANISNIILENDDETLHDDGDRAGRDAIGKRQKRTNLLKDILGVDIELEEDTYLVKGTSKSMLETIKEITYKYYQYTQFKRAHFICETIEHDEETGRVNKMEFRVVLKNGNIKFS